MKTIDWSDKHPLIKSNNKRSDSTIIASIRLNLSRLLEAHHAGNTKLVIAYHDKIDTALHKLVGKEGLRPEERG